MAALGAHQRGNGSMAAFIQNYWLLLTGFLLLGGIIFTIVICLRSSVQPEDHHMAIIYKNGRFSRFAKPNQVTYLIPFKESVFGQVDIAEHTCQVRLSDLLTQDYRKVSVRLFVSYRIDLEAVRNHQYLCDMIGRSEAEWRGWVERVLENIARNEVFPARPRRECFHTIGREALHREMSDRLSHELAHCGVKVDPDFGVMLLNLQRG
jgi:hypothetical protein